MANPTYLSMYWVTNDNTLQNRVYTAMVQTCVNVANESATTPSHSARKSYSATVLNGPGQYIAIFTNVVATNATCANDATANGTVNVSSSNAPTQAALITDTDLANAISAGFNALIVNA